MFAHCLEQPTRTASLTSLPRRYRFRERFRVAAPIRSCSRWGLPCRFRCRKRGALLPHLFTLAPLRSFRSFAGRFVLCGTFPGVAPAGCYPAPHVDGARTFLPRGLSALAGAAVRPTDASRHGGSAAPRQGISLVNCERRPARSNGVEQNNLPCDVGPAVARSTGCRRSSPSRGVTPCSICC